MPRSGGEVEKMFYTYILQNSITKRHYIGSTNDLIRRIAEHNRGQTKSTRQKGNWELKFVEEFESAFAAKKRELKIKSFKGGNAFKNLMRQ
jgi:putative endonuclease